MDDAVAALAEVAVDLCPDGPAVCALEELRVPSTRPFERIEDVLAATRGDPDAADIPAGQEVDSPERDRGRD